MTGERFTVGDIHQMDVGTLRREIEWRKGDFDGSRATLVDRFKKLLAKYEWRKYEWK